MIAALTLLLLATDPISVTESWPQRIDSIELRGLTWTKEYVVLRELPWKPGETVTEERWKLGITRLWNDGIFSRVDAQLEHRGAQTVAVITLEDRFALNPLVSFGVGGGKWWFRLGLNDINFFGHFLEWGARYERFDIFNGAQAWVKYPRLFNKRVEGWAQFDYLFRPRPEYVRRRLGGFFDVGGELSDLLRIGTKLEVFRDEYMNPLEGMPNVPSNLIAGQLSFSLRMGRIDTIRIRQTGLSLELRQTAGLSDNVGSQRYLQSFAEALWFLMLGERFNIGVRAQAGVSANAPTEQQFYLGGLDLIRGYDDSIVRTQAYALMNAEFRATLFDSTWFAVVVAGFVDGALADTNGLRGLLSTGGGLRLLVPKFLKTGLRGDVAVTLTGVPHVGFSFGVFQFF